MRRGAIAVLLSVTAVASLSAQWLDQPTPGIPRTPEGKPILTAPAPHLADGRPDLSGLWRLGVPIGVGANITAGLAPSDIQPWAAALSRKRLEDFGKDDPEITGCLPGGPRHITRPGLAKIIHTPTLLAILYEDLSYRQIFLDGRRLPADPNPSFMGYSVGRWEGDTLVVESAGFNDRTWLDMAGHPHSEALRMTERYRRRDVGHLELQVTFDDPRVYAKPWTVAGEGTLAADTDLIEYVCAENEKDRAHLVGRTEDERRVTVAPAVLATYVGVYEVRAGARNADTARTVFTVSLEDGQLFLDFGGHGHVPMIPLSQTMFSPRWLGTYEFIPSADGVVHQMLVHSAEEVLVAARRR